MDRKTRMLPVLFFSGKLRPELAGEVKCRWNGTRSPTSRGRVEAHAKVNGNVLVDGGEEEAASVDKFLSLQRIKAICNMKL